MNAQTQRAGSEAVQTPPAQRKRFWTPDKIAAGLKAGGGNVSLAVEILRKQYAPRPIGRYQIYRAMHDYPHVAQAARDAQANADSLLDTILDTGISVRANAGLARDQRNLTRIRRQGPTMCKCTPEKRTPYCGGPGCIWPTSGEASMAAGMAESNTTPDASITDDPRDIPNKTHFAIIHMDDTRTPVVSRLQYEFFTNRIAWTEAIDVAYRAGRIFRALEVTPYRPVLKVEPIAHPAMRSGGGTGG